MAQQAVEQGTAIYEGYDYKEKRKFFYFETPSGKRGGVIDRDGVPPSKDEAIMIVPEDGSKPFIGWKRKEAIYVF